MRHQRSLLIISAVVSATLWAYACGDGTTEPPPYFPEPATITVSPATTELTALGATVQLSAEVRDQNGAVMAGATVTWASSDAGAATVNASGLVTAVSNGGATITATAGSASGSAMVTVAQEVSAVAVTPDTATVLEGDTVRLAATATDANGQAVTGTEVAWASEDTAVAVVDASGLVTGVGTGEVQVTATAAGLTGRAELAVVTPLPTTVAVTPDTVVLTAVGQTAQLTAEVRNQAGRVMEGVPVAWLSAETTVAAVDASGLVTAVGGGAVTITATAGEASGDALVTVEIDLDRVALVALYEATGGPNWVDNTNWLTDAPLGEWYGVDTDRQGRVVRLDLSGGWDNEARTYTLHGLSGPIPPELDGLSNLRYLKLNRNDLWGRIPPELGTLSNLESLNLDGNILSGPIPPELGDLANLAELNIGNNSLSGPIPPELGGLSNLRSLYLYNTDLSGPIPPELGRLSNLRISWLLGNALSGPIPPELGNLSNLRRLHLYQNNLSGPIPPELGGLEELRWLTLWGNDLTGEIPPELGGLANLEYLSLSDNDLSGPIPPELGDLQTLVSLTLGNNDLSGPIPPELGGLEKLENLGLGGNELGAFPQTFLNLRSLRNASVQCIPSGVCVPGTSAFVSWTKGVADADVLAFCNASDHAVLTSLYALVGGGEWTESGNWLGGPALEEWHGVETDTLGRVTALVLSDNGLSGPLPGVIADLGQLTSLRIDGNELGGRLPPSLTALDLEEFHYDGTDLCEPADAEFRDWLDGIPSHRGTAVQCPPLTERDALVALYAGTGGPGWTSSNGWLTEAPLRRWSGVEVDAQGRVVGLDLGRNGLSGAIPPELSGLSHLERLNLQANALSSPIPPELGDLSNLTHLALGVNDLSGPIPPELGGLSNLGSLYLHGNELSGAIPPELGRLSNLRYLYLYENELSGAIPPELGRLSNLWYLYLSWNDLSGPIPPELGDLADLRSLSLSRNDLSGPIPPELGGLSNLERLDLGFNAFSGSIPPELSDLSNLWYLYLNSNDLSGVIPSELGGLSNLRRLSLDWNALSGLIPPELGDLANLEGLYLGQNSLSGPVPLTFGGLASLVELEMSHNAGLAGAMPAGLRDLALESLMASGTELCVPREPAFEEWLAAIPRKRIAVCEPPAAYLVQAVQSRTHPVPLVAGEDALLRVFVTAAMATTEGIPEVRARFYLNGTERHVADIPGSSTPIPTEIDEGDLSKSANAEIPGRIVRPGLEMVVEVDPDGVLHASLGVASRIPQEGRLAVEVREMPVFGLTVIPFLWNSDPDSAIIGLVDGMAADPEGHSLLEDTRVLLPIGDIGVSAHAPVASASNNKNDLLRQTEAIRVLEGGGGHYMGMMSGLSPRGGSGIALLSGRSNFSEPNSVTVAHELGHNMSLRHAPCGGAPGPDPSFPYPNGTIGAWGYDFDRGRLVPSARTDHMSYCNPAWTSDYHFTNALRHRLSDEGAAAAALAAGPVRSLLLWGGVNTTGTPFLNPAFVADASPALPDAAGDYTVTGRDSNGRELFSLNFAMQVALAEEAEVSSFVFALPVQPSWADALASVTLTGPAGTAALDGNSDIPMAILRDPRTGQVRGFLRDPSLAAETAADAVGVHVPGRLEVLFSRGIPGGGAWRR